MKNLSIKITIILFAINLGYAQQWMTSLDIAKDMARVQNKMILMVWKESTTYDYAVMVNDDKGRTLFSNNLFVDEDLSPLIWKAFVPVIVNDNKYADLFEEIKEKRDRRYIDKFNDDTIKILDANGYILNVMDYGTDYQNISEIIRKYSLNTEFISAELKNYSEKQTFYTSYFLASKYLDMAMYVNKNVRPEIVELSNIYFEEAKSYLTAGTEKNKPELMETCQLLKIQEDLILEKPRRVLRKLKKMKADEIVGVNEPYVAFLYYTAYKIKGDDSKAQIWESKISSLNLKKAKLLINLNF